jgi:hypothetical protein
MPFLCELGISFYRSGLARGMEIAGRKKADANEIGAVYGSACNLNLSRARVRNGPRLWDGIPVSELISL